MIAIIEVVPLAAPIVDVHHGHVAAGLVQELLRYVIIVYYIMAYLYVCIALSLYIYIYTYAYI